MSVLEGFCLTHQADVPIGPNQRCLADGSLTIAPSYGNAYQRVVDGAWFPPRPPKRPRNQVTRFQPVEVIQRQHRVVERQTVYADVTCEHCGRVTQHPAAYKARFCNETCRQRADYARKHPRQTCEPLACPTCGETFLPIIARQGGSPPRYCSERCRSKASRERHNEKRRAETYQPILVTVVCALCGVEMQRPRMLKARFCSHRCRTIAQQRKRQEARAS